VQFLDSSLDYKKQMYLLDLGHLDHPLGLVHLEGLGHLVLLLGLVLLGHLLGLVHLEVLSLLKNHLYLKNL
jgi:hypothetical protein